MSYQFKDYGDGLRTEIDSLRTKLSSAKGALNEYREHVRELIRLLEIEEESDSGSVFRPNKVSSCRVMDGMQINQCLKVLKELAQE